MEKLRIALDAMGGDNAPKCTVEGAVRAVKEIQNIEIILLGDESKIKAELSGMGDYPQESIQLVHCTEEIEMAEPPVAAIQKKKDSSIVRGMRLVRQGDADAFVSAGSTGAVLAGGQVLVGRLKGVERPPLGALIPTAKGMSLLVDCGANVDARPTWLLQFAEMGSIYMEHVLGVKNPTVGLVNIGAEEEKGNALVKEVFPLLKENPHIHFIGSVEAREIPSGACDVIVTDAFSGNLLLKMYEGSASMLLHQITAILKSSFKGMLGGLLIKGLLKKSLKKFDSKQYGGAPLLGLKGLVVKAHGSSDAQAIRTSIQQCVDFARSDMNGILRVRMEEEAALIREKKKAK
jgi:glycerol-3-phosphate acyltransferase PlsX